MVMMIDDDDVDDIFLYVQCLNNTISHIMHIRTYLNKEKKRTQKKNKFVKYI